MWQVTKKGELRISSRQLGAKFNFYMLPLVCWRGIFFKYWKHLSSSSLHDFEYAEVLVQGWYIVQEEHAKSRDVRFQPVDAQSVRQWHVDLNCLRCDSLLLLGFHELKRPHVMQTVGELDEQDADVLRH